MTEPRYAPGVRPPARAASAPAQVLLAVAAHLASGGCLPERSALLVAVPLAWAAVALLGRCLQTVGAPGRLLAGQAAVHLALTLVGHCADQAFGSTQTTNGGGLTPHTVMALGHLVATALALRAVARAEQQLAHVLRRAAALVVQALLPACPCPLGALPEPGSPISAGTRQTAVAATPFTQHGLRAPPAGMHLACA